MIATFRSAADRSAARTSRIDLLRQTALAGGLLAVMALAGAAPAAAQTQYNWIGNATDGANGVASDWNTASNWGGGVVPPANAAVGFRASGFGFDTRSSAELSNSTIALSSLSLASRNLNLNNADITVSGILTIQQGATITAGPITGSISVGDHVRIQGTTSAGGTPGQGNAVQIFLQTNSGRTAEIRGLSLFHGGSNHVTPVFGGNIISGSFIQNGNIQTPVPGNFGIGVQHGVTLTLSGNISSNTITTARFNVTADPGSASVPNFIGKTVLTGDASGWVGGADVQKGTLQFGDGGQGIGGRLTDPNTNASRFIGGNLTVAAGATIAFNHTDTVTLNNQISGAGAIVKLGTGLLTLTNLTGFTGAIKVDAGTLALGNGVTLANSTTVTVLAGASFSYGNNLQVAQLANANLGTSDLIVDSSASETFAGGLTGARKLEKKSNGTLTLSGVLDYTGLTTVNGGTLELTNDGNTLTGGIVVNGRLVIGASGAAGGANNTITTTGSVISFANGVNSATPININSNDTQLEVLNNDSATQSGVISETAGPRGFEKIGTGTLRLAASNTYSGATVISAGTLIAGNSFTAITPTAALGNDSATNIVRLNGGTLQIDNQVATFARPVEITALNGTLDNVNALTLNGATTFTGRLTKTGAGNLTLNGSGTGAGGLVFNSSGTLEIGNSAALGTGALRFQSGGATLSPGIASVSLANAVVVDATTSLSAATGRSLTLSGAISGAGSLRVVNSGTVNLTGANSFTGGVTLAFGTLGVGSNTALGTGQLSFQQSTTLRALANVTLANAIQLQPCACGGAVNQIIDTNGNTLTLNGVISGQAVGIEQTPYGLTKNGAGTLVLNATNTYRGATVVNAGTLVVNGSINTSSGITIAQGATLGGNGGTPTLTVQGTISPGNSVGVLNINGGLTLASTATTVIEIEGATADRINVTGNATLNGTLQLVAAGGAYAFATPYTILTTTGTRTGTFATITTVGSFGVGVTSAVSYGAQNVQVTLTAAPLVTTPTAATTTSTTVLAQQTPVLGLTQTRNITAVASALDRALFSGSDLSSLFAIYNQPTREALAAAVNTLSGEVHTATTAAGLRASDQFLRVMLDPFAIGRDGSLVGVSGYSGFTADLPGRKGPVSAPAPVRFEPTFHVWGASFGQIDRTRGDAIGAGSATREIKDANIAVGADYRIAPGSVIGFALSGGQSRAELGRNLGSNTADIFQLGLYGATKIGKLNLAASLSYAAMQVETRRNVPALGLNATADYSAHVWGGRLQAAYDLFSAGSFTVSPIAALQIQSVHTPNFREINSFTGAAAGVTGRSHTNTALRSELGLRVTSLTTLGGRKVTLFTEISWAHYYQRDITFAASLTGIANTNFVIEGARPNRDAALFSAGADIQLTPNLTLGGRFDASASGNSRSYAGTGALRASF